MILRISTISRAVVQSGLFARNIRMSKAVWGSLSSWHSGLHIALYACAVLKLISMVGFMRRSFCSYMDSSFLKHYSTDKGSCQEKKESVLLCRASRRAISMFCTNGAFSPCEKCKKSLLIKSAWEKAATKIYPNKESAPCGRRQKAVCFKQTGQRPAQRDKSDNTI